jgi:hypothetical protein
MSVDTALKVIEGRSLRWSSPLKFNDPFDHQIGFSFNFSGEQLGSRIFEEFERIVFSGKQEFKQPTLFSILAMQLQLIKDRLPKDEVMREIKDATNKTAGNFDTFINKLHNTIHAYLTHSRVLCVSEQHDNVVMWSHYADQHQGVVLQLECVDEIDNTLLAARKVKYSRELPCFPSLDSYVRHLTGEEPLDMAKLSLEIAFTKHEDWSYEKEWRVHMPLLNEPPGDGLSIYTEDPRIFGAVYLGCRISDGDAEKVINAVRKHISSAKIYRGSKSARSFELSFDEV